MERKTKPQTEAHSPGLTASVVVCLLGQSPNAGIADTHTATSGLTVVLFLLSLVLVTEVRAVHMLGKCSPLRSTPPPTAIAVFWRRGTAVVSPASSL